eukprot:scaffold36630_cov37-Tisochrysis_lutea.AAC.2
MAMGRSRRGRVRANRQSTPDSFAFSRSAVGGADTSNSPTANVYSTDGNSAWVSEPSLPTGLAALGVEAFNSRLYGAGAGVRLWRLGRPSLRRAHVVFERRLRRDGELHDSHVSAGSPRLLLSAVGGFDSTSVIRGLVYTFDGTSWSIDASTLNHGRA